MTEFKKPLFEKVLLESNDASPMQGTSDNNSYKDYFKKESLDDKTEDNSGSVICSACGVKMKIENCVHKPYCINKTTPSNRNIKIPRISVQASSCRKNKTPTYKNQSVYIQRAD
jgi:hypothetical protein